MLLYVFVVSALVSNPFSRVCLCVMNVFRRFTLQPSEVLQSWPLDPSSFSTNWRRCSSSPMAALTPAFSHGKAMWNSVCVRRCSICPFTIRDSSFDTLKKKKNRAKWRERRGALLLVRRAIDSRSSSQALSDEQSQSALIKWLVVEMLEPELACDLWLARF